MTGRFASALAIAAGIVTAAIPVSRASAQSPAGEVHLLDVPYLPQSESLCGGAAIAMVMRYWGADNIYAETFADLIDPAANGIHGSDLLKALRSRGWDAKSFRGNSDEVRANLNARQPVVALVQDRPGRFHYVVIVGWSAGRVIVHDPARTPFRILDETVIRGIVESIGLLGPDREPAPVDRSRSDVRHSTGRRSQTHRTP